MRSAKGQACQPSILHIRRTTNQWLANAILYCLNLHHHSVIHFHQEHRCLWQVNLLTIMYQRYATDIPVAILNKQPHLNAIRLHTTP